MNTIVKIPRSILTRALVDLQRPHAFASERVGFFSTKRTITTSCVLIHCVDYNPVDDDHYVRDDSVGVRIGPRAITVAMSRSLTSSVGQIHVHFHGGTGLPLPSSVDRQELPGVMRSLENANENATHGWMVLSNNDAWAALSNNGTKILDAPPVSIVGFPIKSNHRSPTPKSPQKKSLLSRLRGRRKASTRYDRQSFLGKDSDSIIGQTMIGIIGLGGGGSHVAQQLSHLGFRNFILCDGDCISESNLNRLVGATQSDLRNKRLKTDIVERNIKKLHADANIVNRSCRWEESISDLMGCDLIIGCVDSFSGRRDLEVFCRRNLIPLIDVGMDVDDSRGRVEIYGQVILSMPGRPCMHCMGFLNEEVLALEARRYGAAGGRPQVVWSNGLLCSAAIGIAGRSHHGLVPNVP